jgi:hypothetical protein
LVSLKKEFTGSVTDAQRGFSQRKMKKNESTHFEVIEGGESRVESQVS